MARADVGTIMQQDLLRFNASVPRDPTIDAWLKERGELGAIARDWFEAMRDLKSANSSMTAVRSPV